MTQTPITLALQGGGTHGAIAWGAVDQILLDDRYDIEAITASSGGAMTAVVLADALLRDGPEEARNHLKNFWRKVSVAASLLPFRTTVVDKMLANVGIDLSPSSMALDYFTKIFSPYQFNLFDLNPLRAIVEEMVDFEALRAQSRLEIFINTTDAKTGSPRVFSTPDISLEVVMASACLPYLFKTVMLDGEPHWDGGYSASPALTPFMETPRAREVVVCETILPLTDEAPTKAPDILDHATEISFHNTYLLQQQLVAMHNRYNPNAAITLHRLQASEVMAGLGRASKLNADWDFLLYLHDIGVQAASDWLSQGYVGAKKPPAKKAG